jgi:hypothetical protein
MRPGHSHLQYPLELLQLGLQTGVVRPPLGLGLEQQVLPEGLELVLLASQLQEPEHRLRMRRVDQPVLPLPSST